MWWHVYMTGKNTKRISTNWSDAISVPVFNTNHFAFNSCTTSQYEPMWSARGRGGLFWMDCGDHRRSSSRLSHQGAELSHQPSKVNSFQKANTVEFFKRFIYSSRKMNRVSTRMWIYGLMWSDVIGISSLSINICVYQMLDKGRQSNDCWNSVLGRPIQFTRTAAGGRRRSTAEDSALRPGVPNLKLKEVPSYQRLSCRIKWINEFFPRV